jgi:hypothetical protein
MAQTGPPGIGRQPQDDDTAEESDLRCDRAESEEGNERRPHRECRITWAEVVGIEADRMDATREPEDFPFLAESSRRRPAVLRRCTAPLIVLATALAFGLGSQPMSSRADSVTSSSSTPTVTLDYTLTASQPITPAGATAPTQTGSSTPTPQVLALDTPISIVTPSSSSSTGPLQIVSDSSGYYYDNPSQLLVGVGNTTLNGSSVQALALTFYGQGLSAGSSLTFSLTFNKNIVDGNPPQIPQFTVVNPTTLQPISTYQIKYDGVASGSGSSSTTTSGQNGGGVAASSTPEPLSWLLWSALAGAGMWRVRTRSRR